jgi:hypothetical protein
MSRPERVGIFSAVPFTRHANMRSKQRGIRHCHVEALLTFGASKIRHGCEVVYMNKLARERARQSLGRQDYAQIEPAFDVYLVIADDGSIVTCAHRTKKLHF